MDHQSLIATSTSLTGSDGSSVVIKQEPKDSYSQTVDVKCENDSKVGDSQLSIKIVRCESLKTGIVQDDDQLSQLREVSGEIDCKDGINISNHEQSVDTALQTDEEQYDVAHHERFGDSGINEDIKREGWYNYVQIVIFHN